MFPNDHTLLNTPQLISLILHQADSGTATVAGCIARLRDLLEQANEPLPLEPAEIERRLNQNFAALRTALLIERHDDGYRLTRRGREALKKYPLGFDRADLMQYPEYADASVAGAHHSAGMDARLRSYDLGYAAHRAGLSFNDNPYTENTVDHQSWENGWMESLDEPQDIPPA